MIRVGEIGDYASIKSFDPFGGDRQAELSAGHCLVALEKERVMAYVTFSRDGFIGRAFVHFLAVDAAFRRRGIATGLLEAVAKAVGAGRLFISTEETNQEMLSLLAKLDWTAAGMVQGVNTNGAAEVFYFRDFSDTSSAGRG